MTSEAQLDAAVRRVLSDILTEGDPYTSLPLVDPDTKLFPDPTLDAIRGPLQAELDELTPTVAEHETELTGRLSEPELNATFVGTDVDGNPVLGGGPVPGLMRGTKGKSFAFVAGVIRNYNDGNGWVLLTDGFHPPIGITDCDSLTDTGLIRIDYPGLKIDGGDAGRTVTLMAMPDETLAKAGFTVGCSVEPDVARLQLWQARSLNDRLYYDTGTSSYKLWKNEFWAAGRSPFTVASATSNHVILTHAQAIVEERFDFGIDRIGGVGENYTPTLSTNTADTILTQINVDFWTATLTGSETKDWGSVADGAFASEDVTVTGCALGDIAEASMSVAVPAGVMLTASVTAANTVTVTLTNRSGAPVDLASGTLTALTRKASGADYRVTTPDTKCRAYVRRGMSRTYVAPADVHEGTYPNGNIWIIGIMQDAA